MDTQRTEQVEKTTEFVNGANNAEIAKPSDTHCMEGTLHAGEPRGKTITVAGVETYIVEPPQGKANGHVVVYYPDVWGFFQNGFLVCVKAS